MPSNVNLIEMQACLRDLKAHVEQHPRKSYVNEFGERVLRVHRALDEDVAMVDARFIHWRLEIGEEKLALKHLQRTFKRAQKALSDAGALGYPEQVVNYWDEDDTLAAAREMLDFLREHQSSLDFADDFIGDLDRLLSGSRTEMRETTDALDAYRRVMGQRKVVMENALQIIGAVRRAMREDLGVGHADYQSIKWPAMLEPDPR